MLIYLFLIYQLLLPRVDILSYLKKYVNYGFITFMPFQWLCLGD